MVATIVAIIIIIIISRLFKSGSLNVQNNEAIENFSMHYATGSDLVKKAIELLLDINQRENIRANKRKLNVQERNEKGYDKYNWEELTENGGLNKLTVSELDKYLNYHRLPRSGKKLTKLKRIICHTCRPNNGQVQSLVTARSICDEDTDTTSDDSEEEIIEEFGSSDDTLDGELHPQLTTITRSGRVAGSWRNVFI